MAWLDPIKSKNLILFRDLFLPLAKAREFRLAFNKVAIRHSSIPHINKTDNRAINHFAQAHDLDSIRQFL
ncbi:Uncharacterized protein HZ326_18929 [Fusarium oxysporum f. sp. albedinis]|nr:Uncharacterized protein HZ326_18929 [Fusarium oxysporum f. sp. albedinis]